VNILAVKLSSLLFFNPYAHAIFMLFSPLSPLTFRRRKRRYHQF